jgi:hypothetical protein
MVMISRATPAELRQVNETAAERKKQAGRRGAAHGCASAQHRNG